MSQHTAYTITCCLLAGWLSVASLWGQDGPKEKPQKIEIKQAGSLRYDDSKGIKAQRLVDDVIFKTNTALMYCDSAYLYSDANRLEAFGNVRITEGDSVELRGDTMYYDGNTDLTRVRGNITLEDNNTLLTTRYLDYNGQTDMVYYLGGGRIVNKSSTDTLTSTYGYYFPKQKTYYFKDSVVMRTPTYTIRCDTMQYNTLTEITRFFGPTHITGDSTNIYCERGWYDPKNDQAMFKQQAYMQRNAQELAGDSVFYDHATGIGEAFGHVTIRDTVENFIVKGDWGINYEKDSMSIVTGHAELIQVFARDSLFLHADTLYSSFDSTRQHRIIQAYHGVRFFKPDLQGKCDSLVFSNADTTIRMYVDPVIWSEANQLTADTIILRNRDGELDRMWMDHNAFIISKDDTNKFNQIKGKNMVGHFVNSDLHKVDVNGNGQTIYYTREEDRTLIGVNKTVCSDMIIWVDSNQVKRIKLIRDPQATLTPWSKSNPKELLLPDFKWRGKSRPQKREDIFVREEEGSSSDAAADDMDPEEEETRVSEDTSEPSGKEE